MSDTERWSFIYIIENVDLMLEMKSIVKIFPNTKYAFSHEKLREVAFTKKLG